MNKPKPQVAYAELLEIRVQPVYSLRDASGQHIRKFIGAPADIGRAEIPFLLDELVEMESAVFAKASGNEPTE